MTDAIILDIGHGNATVFVDEDQALVVDAGGSDLVTRTLEAHGITTVHALVVSHRHHDHTSELPALLSNPALRILKLFINTDKNRGTSSAFERDLVASFHDSHARNGTELHQLNETLDRQFTMPTLEVDVVWPSAGLALGGVGEGPDEVAITPHAMSGVLRIGRPGGRSALLCGDIGHAELEQIFASEAARLSTTVLVYPHHGGRSGANDDEALARRLTALADPELVVFSHGRARYRNPRPEVVRGVRSARRKPPIRVLCTQLSKNCSSTPAGDDGRLDSNLSHSGADAGHSCGGSIRVALDDEQQLLPLGSAHLDFVLHRVENSLCMPGKSGPPRAPVIS